MYFDELRIKTEDKRTYFVDSPTIPEMTSNYLRITNAKSYHSDLFNGSPKGFKKFDIYVVKQSDSSLFSSYVDLMSSFGSSQLSNLPKFESSLWGMEVILSIDTGNSYKVYIAPKYNYLASQHADVIELARLHNTYFHGVISWAKVNQELVNHSSIIDDFITWIEKGEWLSYNITESLRCILRALTIQHSDIMINSFVDSKQFRIDSDGNLIFFDVFSKSI